MVNLKAELKHTGGLGGLSITSPASYWYLQHFDMVKLKKSVDFFNIMSYDLHGARDKGNKWTGEYLNRYTNLTEIDMALDPLWRNNINSKKVILSLTFYARAYIVVSTSWVELGCLFASGSNKGDCGNEIGIVLNSEI
jgi:chitinase